MFSIGLIYFTDKERESCRHQRYDYSCIPSQVWLLCSPFSIALSPWTLITHILYMYRRSISPIVLNSSYPCDQFESLFITILILSGEIFSRVRGSSYLWTSGSFYRFIFLYKVLISLFDFDSSFRLKIHTHYYSSKLTTSLSFLLSFHLPLLILKLQVRVSFLSCGLWEHILVS